MTHTTTMRRTQSRSKPLSSVDPPDDLVPEYVVELCWPHEEEDDELECEEDEPDREPE
jgi:hypothetical protein